MPLKVVLDTETTGLSPRDAAVVQVALAYRDPATRGVEAWSEVCDPGASHYAGGRAARAFAVNGLTEARVAAARPARVVAAELRARLAVLAERHGGVDLRAYNVGFDQPFLAAQPWGLAGPWGACLMLEAAQAIAPGGRWLRLADACARLGLAFPGRAHDAASDAHAALLVHEAVEARRAVPA